MNDDSMIVSLRHSKRRVDSESEVVRAVEPKRKKIGKLWYAVAGVIAVAVLAGGGYSYYADLGGVFSAFTSESSLLRAAVQESATLDEVRAQAAADVEIENVLMSVGKLIRLPEDEVPTVATVSEPEKLKDQSFFAHATVGDKVLIYTKARKAYLYNPRDNILIEVAPINTDPL